MSKLIKDSFPLQVTTMGQSAPTFGPIGGELRGYRQPQAITSMTMGPSLHSYMADARLPSPSLSGDLSPTAEPFIPKSYPPTGISRPIGNHQGHPEGGVARFDSGVQIAGEWRSGKSYASDEAGGMQGPSPYLLAGGLSKAYFHPNGRYMTPPSTDLLPSGPFARFQRTAQLGSPPRSHPIETSKPHQGTFTLDQEHSRDDSYFGATSTPPTYPFAFKPAEANRVELHKIHKDANHGTRQVQAPPKKYYHPLDAFLPYELHGQIPLPADDPRCAPATSEQDYTEENPSYTFPHSDALEADKGACLEPHNNLSYIEGVHGAYGVKLLPDNYLQADDTPCTALGFHKAIHNRVEPPKNTKYVATHELLEQQGLIRRQIQPGQNYLGTGKNPRHEANLPDNENCTLFLTGIPVGTTISEIFATIDVGAVYCLHINPATVLFSTMAGKLSFMTPEAAARYMSKIHSQEGIWFYGMRMMGRYNREGDRRNLQHLSRVIVVAGPEEIMTVQFWFKYFTQICVFRLEAVQYIPHDTPGKAIMEFRFARVDGQAQACLRAIQLQDEFRGVINVVYGIDTCGPAVEGNKF